MTGRTSNLKPFQPGQSGNPAGRPRIPQEVRELARAHSAEALEVHVRIMRNRKAAPTARAASATAILDRAWGKPPQSIEQTNIPGRPEGMTDEALTARILQVSKELGDCIGPNGQDAVLLAGLERVTGKSSDTLIAAMSDGTLAELVARANGNGNGNGHDAQATHGHDVDRTDDASADADRYSPQPEGRSHGSH